MVAEISFANMLCRPWVMWFLNRLSILAKLKYKAWFPSSLEPDVYTIVVTRRKGGKKRKYKKGFIKLGEFKITPSGQIVATKGKILPPLNVLLDTYFHNKPLSVYFMEELEYKRKKLQERYDFVKRYERYKKKLFENVELFKVLYR